MTIPSDTSLAAKRKILCATNFSAASYAAFRASIKLCSSLKASLTVLHVVEYADQIAPEDGGPLLRSDNFYIDAEHSLHALMQEASRAGIVCKGVMAHGVAHTCIAETQKREHMDLVVLGTRSIRGFERLVFGSTAESVLRSVSCPVFTLGPQAAQHALDLDSNDEAIVFATDFHVTTTGALRFATLLALNLHLPLHCLHVLPRGVHDDLYAGIIPQIMVEGLQHLAARLEPALVPPVCAVTYGSEVSGAVIEYARLHHARIIVLGIRRASLLASHIPAHIVYKIITDAPCAVVTIAYPELSLHESDQIPASKTPVSLEQTQTKRPEQSGV